MKLVHRNRGYHDNQSDNSIVAIVDGEVVGFLDYSEYRGEIHIQMIEVDEKFRRQGIGTALLKELDKEYPEVEIEYGMETPEGARLIEEYQRRYPKKLDFERGFSNRDFVLSFVPDYGKNADKVSWHSLSFAFSETGLDLDKYDFNWEPGKKQFEQDIKRVTDKGWAAAAKQLRSDLGIKHNAEMRVASISAGVKDERRWDTDSFPKRLSPTWEMPTLGDEPLSEITTTWRSVNPQERGKHLMMSRELLKVAKDLLAFGFPTQEALDKYLKEHPAADKTLHYVIKTRSPVVPAKPEMPPKTKSRVTPEEDSAYAKAAKSGDKETAEKMVGKAAKEAGYAVGPVWHGTDAPIKDNAFSLEMRGTSTPDASAKEGFFFTDRQDEAQVYANEAVWTKRRDSYRVGEKNGITLPFYIRINNPMRVSYAGSTNADTLRKAKSAGHDGVIDERGDFVVFDPSQIKSADPFIYRDDGTLIPLSERFDRGSKDIRSSLTERKTFISREILKVAKDLLAIPSHLKMKTEMEKAKADRKRQERELNRYVGEVGSLLHHLVEPDSTARKLAEKVFSEIPGRNVGTVLTQRKNRWVKEAKQIPEIMAFTEYIGGSERMSGSALYLVRDVVLGQMLLKEAKGKAESMAGKWFIEKTLSEKADVFESAGYDPDFRKFLPPNVSFTLGPTREVLQIVETFGREKKNWANIAKKLAFIAQRFNDIVASVKADLRSSDEVTRMCALMTAITIETGLRPGQVGNAAKIVDPDTGEEIEIETFGVTTLQPAHVKFVRKNFAELNFVGKMAGQQVATLSDVEILAALKEAVESTNLAGNTSMIFVTKAGEHVDYSELKKYVADKWGDITPTDFRKLKATREFYDNLQRRIGELRNSIRGVLSTEKSKLRERVIAEIIKVLEAAATEAQTKLSHDQWLTTIKSYVDPRVVVNFLSRGGLDDSLDDILINGKNVRLVFDLEAFVRQAEQEKMLKSAATVVTMKEVGQEPSLAEAFGELVDLSETLSGDSVNRIAVTQELLKVAKVLLAIDTPEWVNPAFVGQLDIASTNLKKYSGSYRGIPTWILQSKSKVYKDQYGWVSASWTINPALDGQNWVIESALSFAPATSGSFANQKFAEFKNAVTIAGKKDLAMFGAERHVLTVKPDETNALREVNGVIAQHRDSFNAAKKFWKSVK